MNDNKLSSPVQVIDRAFKIMETVAKKGAMSLKDIYTTLGINKASTFRIVQSLFENGYFRYDEHTGNYSLSFKAFEVGVYAIRHINYIGFIKNTLDKLSSELGVTAQFSVEDNNELLCLESYDPSKNNLSMYTRIGQRSPLYATSAGKAILSCYSNDEIREKWNNFHLHMYTRNTITSLDALLKDISRIRQCNYAIDNEECEYGLFCVGTVLLNYNRKPIGAISLSANRMTKEYQQKLADMLLTYTRRLSYMLGYSLT